VCVCSRWLTGCEIYYFLLWSKCEHLRLYGRRMVLGWAKRKKGDENHFTNFFPRLLMARVCGSGTIPLLGIFPGPFLLVIENAFFLLFGNFTMYSHAQMILQLLDHSLFCLSRADMLLAPDVHTFDQKIPDSAKDCIQRRATYYKFVCSVGAHCLAGVDSSLFKYRTKNEQEESALKRERERGETSSSDFFRGI
jgi:hypothetical protein